MVTRHYSTVWFCTFCSLPSSAVDPVCLVLQLLLAGLRALKPGGRLVYSTCSMSAVENDEVVLQAVQQSQGSVLAVPVDEWGVMGSDQLREAAGAELTQHGMLCLPDRAGCGPIYLCLLQKQEL